MHAKLTPLALALAVAGCAAPLPTGSPPASTQSFAAAPAAGASPDLACPAVGRTFVRGKSSTVLARKTALADLSTHVQWKVVFTGQPKPAAPVQFVPKLLKCGPSPGSKPIGSARDAGGGTTRSQCSNGACTVEVYYTVIYRAPAKLPGNKPWRYDLIRFYPSKPKPPYGELPGVLLEVKNLP